MDEKIKELTLLLLYISGWEEDFTMSSNKEHLGFIREDGTRGEYRSWLKHEFEVLNELQEEGMIYTFPNGKSAIIPQKGIEKAEELKKKYLG